jgi:hypothetical protein
LDVQHAQIWVPVWVVRNPHIAEILRFAASTDQRYKDQGVVCFEGHIAREGNLPSSLVRELQEHEIPFDFFIKEDSIRGFDRRGYWRPGMQEPSSWSEVDGKSFVCASDRRDILSVFRLIAVGLADPEHTKPTDLRDYPDPRGERSESIRSGVDDDPVRRPQRRPQL